MKWQTFWNSFNSAIHSNPQLSKIDQLNHLHSPLESQTAPLIPPLPKSEADYSCAINILHHWLTP